jgi:predicted RNase H-like nuclease (RuvC/YqgF family)
MANQKLKNLQDSSSSNKGTNTKNNSSKDAKANSSTSTDEVVSSDEDNFSDLQALIDKMKKDVKILEDEILSLKKEISERDVTNTKEITELKEELETKNREYKEENKRLEDLLEKSSKIINSTNSTIPVQSFRNIIKEIKNNVNKVNTKQEGPDDTNIKISAKLEELENLLAETPRSTSSDSDLDSVSSSDSDSSTVSDISINNTPFDLDTIRKHVNELEELIDYCHLNIEQYYDEPVERIIIKDQIKD